MAATSYYPEVGDPIIKGDALTIKVRISDDGVPQNISNWTWDADVRATTNGPVVCSFTFRVDNTDTSLLYMDLSESDTALLVDGMKWSLKSLTPVRRTWWICKGVRTQESFTDG